MDNKPVKYNDKGYGRYSREDIEFIKKVFGNDPQDILLKFLRKVFLPGLDTNATIGALMDPWSSSTEGIDVNKMTPEECKIYFVARGQVLRHLETQLQALKIVSGMEKEEPIEAAMRRSKDSSK